MADYFASSVVSTRKTRCHLVAFTAKGTGTDSYRVEMPNETGNFRNFQISRKKDNLKRWTKIFETIFRKVSVPFDFEPGFPEILESQGKNLSGSQSSTELLCLSEKSSPK